LEKKQKKKKKKKKKKSSFFAWLFPPFCLGSFIRPARSSLRTKEKEETKKKKKKNIGLQQLYGNLLSAIGSGDCGSCQI